MKVKNLVALALTLVMVFSFSISTLAAENTSVIEIDPNTVVQTPEIIGRLSDQDGILLPDGPATRDIGTLFSMTATQVTTLLTTYQVTGKNFTGGDMDAFEGEGLRISGKVTSSLGTGSNYIVKCGACYYEPYSDTFISVAYNYWPSGESRNYWWPKIDFNNSITYYGHITNSLGSGYVYGSLTYSVDTE